jgi:hypothetical protein
VESIRIASTPLLPLRALGGAGDRSYERLTDLLRSRLSPEHAALLAEPVLSGDGTRIDWYIPGVVEARPALALSPPQRDEVVRRCQQRIDDITRLSEELARSPTAADRATAAALLNATKIPEQSCLFSVDGQPVLVAWAYTRENLTAQVAPTVRVLFPPDFPETPTDVESNAPIVTTVDPKKAQVDEAPTPSQPEIHRTTIPDQILRPGLLLRNGLWLLFFVLSSGFVWWLLFPCRVNIPGIGEIRPPFSNYCSQAAGPAATDPALMNAILVERKHAEDLTQILAEIEGRYQSHTDICAMPPGPVTQQIVPRSIEKPVPDPVTAKPLGTGKMQITLIWDGHADLDLRVDCNDASINFRRRQGCGGALDVDANASDPFLDNPAENIFWTGPPPPGRYTIYVALYNRNSDPRDAIPFKLRIRRDNREEAFEGNINILKTWSIVRVVDIAVPRNK